jgi:hypothetical protein
VLRVRSVTSPTPATTDSRLKNLRAALAFLRLSPTEPELRLQHRCFDNWHGLGMMTVGAQAVT